MRKSLGVISGFFMAVIVNAQTMPLVTAWNLNTDGQKGVYQKYNDVQNGGAISTVNMTDSAKVLKVCYTSSSVFVKINGLADYTMGPWMYDPNVPSAQGNTFKFPKTPTQQTGSKMAVPGGGPVAVAINGVFIYGFRDANSYNSSTGTNVNNGDGFWHTDARYNEGPSMDATGYGHADQNGRYHYHAKPKALYTDPSTNHSPIIGFALDGYPIYGPFGYSNATDNTSSIKRITSSYQLRNISDRTTLPNGTTSNPAGPSVSSSYPLGMYCEDYEYVNGLGDLDSLNGRYCVTPEYPDGTYAYFITTDDNGDPAYPYILGSYYYGTISASDMGPNVGNATIPASGVTCVSNSNVTSVISSLSSEGISVYPNPVSDLINIEIGKNKYSKVSISDVMGRVVSALLLTSDKISIPTGELEKGVYYITVFDDNGNSKVVSRFIKQ